MFFAPPFEKIRCKIVSALFQNWAQIRAQFFHCSHSLLQYFYLPRFIFRLKLNYTIFENAFSFIISLGRVQEIAFTVGRTSTSQKLCKKIF